MTRAQRLVNALPLLSALAVLALLATVGLQIPLAKRLARSSPV